MTGGGGGDGALVSIDAADPASPPRRNGELVFDAPWQGRAFGICLAALEREQLPWEAFRQHLVPVLARRPDADYYDCFADALHAFLDDIGVATAEAPRQ